MLTDTLKGGLYSGLFGFLPTARNSPDQFEEEVQESGLFPSLLDGLTSNGDKVADFLFGEDRPSLSDINLDDLLGGDTSANSPGSALRPETFQYLNAELSKAYGMDRNTAYQEALSNTAYQRAVADMQRAGLNPAAIFGAGRGSTAGGVSFIGNSSIGSGSGAAKSGLFTQDQYHGLAAVTGLITAIATKDPSKYYLGSTAAQGVMSALNALDQSVK